MASVLLVASSPLVIIAVLNAHVCPASLVALVTQMVMVIRVALVVVVTKVVLTQETVAAEVVPTEVEAKAVALFEVQGNPRMTSNIGRFFVR